MSQARALLVHPDDDVIVLLSPSLVAGTTVMVGDETFSTGGAIPTGHKIARRLIKMGEAVRKYGQIFGQATADIQPGEWVHTHNVTTLLDKNERYSWNPNRTLPQKSVVDPAAVPTFQGYLRADGRVGTRNELWILCTVGCINRLAEEVARRAHCLFAKEFGGSENIDGVYAHLHPYGCAQIGDDLLQTRGALAALAAHPNCAGVLLMGLGCENNIIQEQVATFRNADSARVRYFSAQDVTNEIDAALEHLQELATASAQDRRVEISVSRLVLGMKCGGSDGFSGLTANPLVGVVADKLASYGGTSILTEVPEMFGAERLLMERAKDEPTFHQIETMINDFKAYFRRYDEPISENPAPGNKAGGITTLEEKSLGCIQKGGASAAVKAVLPYGMPLSVKERNEIGGIALAYGPGNDAVSCTTLAMAGASLVLFTTGRGTPFGTCVPTLKISTNTDLANRKPHWIDFDAGGIADGASMATLAESLWQQVLDVASGRQPTRNEINGYREIAIFKDGVTT